MDTQLRFKEKSVIIHRDENGFGLRVGGQNPVFVHCVHENGAAWKAGVRKDDLIIKVNGTLVRSYDHQRVVHMIQNCTPFVNLTLHSPEQVVVSEPFNVVLSTSGLQSSTPETNIITSNNPNSANNSGGLSLTGNSNDANNITNSNISLSNAVKLHHHSFHHHNHLNNHTHDRSNHRIHLHSHSVGDNHLNWLLNIGDDLFQDTHQQINHNQSVVQPDPNVTLHHGGVSKLIVSGPSPTSQTQSSSSSTKSKTLRHSRTQPSNARDNPYYYYKPEHKVSESKSCNSNSTSSLLGSDEPKPSSKSGLSIVRSRSSGKMSRSSTSVTKHKARNLRSRLVEDLKSLSIVNNQSYISSLSTSSSSSELSECEEQESSRIECVSMNASANSSAIGVTISAHNQSDLSMISTSSAASRNQQKTKHTRRLDIIKELIDTEKTHTDRLKHLNDLLYKPIKSENLVPQEQLRMVFSCHKTLYKIHLKIYRTLLAAQMNIPECHHEPLIGRALLDIFEGELGRRLEKAASTFCACQSVNGELLNRLTRKDTKVGEFLAQVANQQLIGRLGIKDLLASCFQRLTKYPLLLDNLLKATPTGPHGIHSKSLSEGSIVTLACAVKLSDTQENDHETNGNSKDGELYNKTTINNNNENNDNDNNENNDNDNNVTNSDQDIAGDNHSRKNSITTPAIPTNIATSSTVTANSATLVSSSSPPNNLMTNLEEDYSFERLCISRSLQQSRQILTHVNDAVKRATSHNKLREIWRKTEKTPSDKLPVIDIETQQLLHEGALTLRLAKRTLEVYVLLLTHYLIILTRDGQDKFKLKHFNAENKLVTQLSPICSIDEHLATRDTATDENGFYLLCKRKDHSRIYEFASQSPSERAIWKEKIHLYYNIATVPDDDNTLTRYRDLISLRPQQSSREQLVYEPLSAAD